VERVHEIGCSFHHVSRVLICQTCQYGLHTGPNNTAPLNHFKTYHTVRKDFLDKVKEIFATLNTANPNNILLPTPFDPAIPDLRLYHGWYCRRPLVSTSGGTTELSQCRYLSHSTAHFMRHQNAYHRNNNPADFLCQKVLMQSFFPNTYKRWFPVADVSVFNHRQLYTQRPAWRIPIEQTISQNLPQNRGNHAIQSREQFSPSVSDAVNSTNSIEELSWLVIQTALQDIILRILKLCGSSSASDIHDSDMMDEFLAIDSGQSGHNSNILQPTPGLPDTPWLSRTGWSTHLAGCDLVSLAYQTEHPGWQDENDLNLIFTAVVEAAESYFQNACKIAQSSSHALRRWARSISSTECSPAPFRFVQSPATFKRYTRYWTRLLCYLCRSALPDSASQGVIQFTTQQSDARNKVIFRAEEFVHGYRSSTSKLERSIHTLFLTLIQQYLPSTSYENPLLHFLACMGIDKCSGSFRQPGTFTPILAGFVYCIRIIIIYEAHRLSLPLKNNNLLSTFRSLHSQYLTSNSEYPFGDIINLLGYGIKCCTDISHPIIQWSTDRNSVIYHNQKLEITNLGRMIGELVDISYSIGLNFFGWEETDLAGLKLREICDELGNRQIGYSFLNDQRNSEILNPRRILRRFLSTSNPISGLFSSPVPSQLRSKYRLVVQEEFEKLLHTAEIFLEILLVLSHLACGQPPRGTELLSVLVCNTPTHQRHIFVINGELGIITNYNKSQSVVGKGTIILRTFPQCISRLWICYLAFTKPLLAFAEKTLHNQLNSSANSDLLHSKSIAFYTLPIYDQTTPPTVSNLLFHSRQNAWKTIRLTNLLRYYGLEYLSFEALSVSVYRHLAISIFRKRIQHAVLVEDMHHEKEVVPIATRQAGHSQTTSRRYYATEISQFNLLDYHMLDQFQQTSQAWHHHFHLDQHVLYKLRLPAAISNRLNPPIGSKAPLRLPRKTNPARKPNQSRLQQHVKNHGRLTMAIACIKIVKPPGFRRQNYAIYE